jgi:hypothetical protein
VGHRVILRGMMGWRSCLGGEIRRVFCGGLLGVGIGMLMDLDLSNCVGRFWILVESRIEKGM